MTKDIPYLTPFPIMEHKVCDIKLLVWKAPRLIKTFDSSKATGSDKIPVCILNPHSELSSILAKFVRISGIRNWVIIIYIIYTWTIDPIFVGAITMFWMLCPPAFIRWLSVQVTFKEFWTESFINQGSSKPLDLFHVKHINIPIDNLMEMLTFCV